MSFQAQMRNALLHRLGKKHPCMRVCQSYLAAACFCKKACKSIFVWKTVWLTLRCQEQQLQFLLTNESTFGGSHADVYRPLAFHESSKNLDSRLSQGNCCQDLKLGLKLLPYESQGVPADLQPLFCRRRHGAD